MEYQDVKALVTISRHINLPFNEKQWTPFVAGQTLPVINYNKEDLDIGFLVAFKIPDPDDNKREIGQTVQIKKEDALILYPFGVDKENYLFPTDMERDELLNFMQGIRMHCEAKDGDKQMQFIFTKYPSYMRRANAGEFFVNGEARVNQEFSEMLRKPI